MPLIVGLGQAAELARKHLPVYENKVRLLRDALEEGILGGLERRSPIRRDGREHPELAGSETGARSRTPN